MTSAFLWMMAGFGCWIAAAILTPNDTLPWWIKLFMLAFYCFMMGIYNIVSDVRRKLK
jgi:hypothetical protein